MSQDFIGAMLTLALVFSLSWNVVLGCSWLSIYRKYADPQDDGKIE